MTGPALSVLDGVRWRGEPVPGNRSRRLLVVLAAAAPHAVPVHELVARVWDDRAPDHPEKALQVLVSRTRGRTEPRAVELAGTGYRLGLDDTEVDALELRRLVTEARTAEAAGDADTARVCAEAALAVPVAPDDDPAAAGLAAAAESLRQEARLVLAGAALATGDHERALALLEPAVAARPGDEHLLERLLRAEAAVRGVPAALARYAAHADDTRERLGAEPGERLRRLHLDLLARESPVREGLTYDAVPMVGRDGDVRALRALLDHARVVSVVGPGGLGKTRMAHLVGRLAEQPVVRLVELAGVRAADGVLPELASAVGVRDAVTTTSGWRPPSRSGDLRARVAEHLAGAPTLLVVDNCEHVVATVADLVAFLVATVPDLSVLTTSRAPLGIAAETVYQLPQLDADAAVELFRSRATAARPGVRLDEGEVRALVLRLDGLPLAIELAAAKVRAMSVADVHRRLGDRFGLLRDGHRAAPDRHRTLEAVIDWSWQLLPDRPREALRLLSVFPDGFSLAGAEAVLGRDPLTDITHLADQSLLVVREDDEVRYRFLETVREYAGQRLDEAGEREAAERRLVGWAVTGARALRSRLQGPDQVAVVQEVAREAGNLAGVLRRALVDGDRAVVVPLLATLLPFWTLRGDHSSALGIAGAVLDLLAGADDLAELSPDDADELRVVLADLAVGTAILSGMPPTGVVDRLRTLGPGPAGRSGSAMARLVLAVFDTGDVDTLEEMAADEDSLVAVTALVWMCQSQENSGDLDAALATSRRVQARLDDRVPPGVRALVDSQTCGLAIQAGDGETAVRAAERALPVVEALGSVEDAVQLRSAIALVEVGRGNVERATRMVEGVGGTDQARRGDGWVFGLASLAEVALAKGSVEEGLRLYRETVVNARLRSYPGLALDVDLTPWLLFAEAAALAAHVRHDRAPAAADLGAHLARQLARLLAGEAPHFDVPVLGLVLVALGEWGLAEAGPDQGAAEIETLVRMLALGERMGYYRGIPSLSWEFATSLAERRAPGVLRRMAAEYAGRTGSALLEEARALPAPGYSVLR